MDKTTLTIEAFNATAGAYESKFMDCSSYGPHLNAFCQALPTSARVLDLGCGPGNVARFMLDARPDLLIMGVDLAPAMVERFRKNVPEATAKVCDLRHVGALGECFEAAMASFCLPFLTHNEATVLIRALALVSCPQGALYLSTMQGRGEGLEKTSFGGERDFFFNYYERAFLDDQLDKAGFEVVSYQEQVYAQEHAADLTDMIYLAHRR